MSNSSVEAKQRSQRNQKRQLRAKQQGVVTVNDGDTVVLRVYPITSE